MMSVSEKISEHIRDRDKNFLLHSPTLLPVQVSSRMDLSTDHPNFPPEDSIIAGAIKAIEDGQTHYVDVPGVQSLREGIHSYLKEAGFSHLQIDHVQVAAGMQECRFLTVQNIGDHHDSIGLPEVVHPGVRKAVGIRPLKVVTLAVDENRLLPTIEGIQKAADDGCKLMFLESPSRLTGAVYSASEVDQIGRLVKDYSLDILWDQGLSPWVKEGAYVSLGSLADIQENVTTMGELWPGAGLDRFYLGYITGPEKWMKILKTQKQVLSICTNAQIQFAAINALPVYLEKHSIQVSELEAEHQKAAELLDKGNLEIFAGDTVNLIAFKSDSRVGELLAKEGYQFVDGKDFGKEGVLRISITLNGAVLEALKHIR